MITCYSSLHGHSHFSIADGLSTPDEIVKTAQDKGLRSVAITDHGVNHSHADLFLSGKKRGMRVVFGTEAYIIHSIDEWKELKSKIDEERKKKGKADSEGDEFDDDSSSKLNAKELRRKGHLVLLATNRKGLENVNRLVYESHKKGFYSKPRMDKAMLRERREGIVASTACIGGVIANKLWAMQDGIATWDEVVAETREFEEIFGKGRFFLELQFNELEKQKFINSNLVRLSRELDIPLTVTSDFHYSVEDEWEARAIMHMLRSKKTIADIPGGKIDSEIKQLYVKSPQEMWDTYLRFAGDVDEATAIKAFENTLLIDSLVEDYTPDTHQRLPTLPFDNPFKEMGQRAIDGLKRLGLDQDERYTKQLMHELKIIKDKGIANYFIVTQNIVAEAKKKMLVGNGRGSSASSLVCYCLGITDLDPIKHRLMFERFIDPARVELPDIDTDYQDVDEVKDILRGMFGEDNVACLSTYNTFQVKGLLKDVSRVFGIDHVEVNVVNKKIDQDLKTLYIGQDKSTIVIKLEDVERVSPAFRAFVEKHPQVGLHLRKLYNKNRSIGRHASGVIVGDDLPGETAIFTSKGVVQASFTEGIVGKSISAMGFVKFDVLSLATLSVIDDAIKRICNRELDYVKLSLEDGSVHEVLEHVMILTKNRGAVKASELDENDDIDEKSLEVIDLRSR